MVSTKTGLGYNYMYFYKSAELQHTTYSLDKTHIKMATLFSFDE